MLRLVLAAAFLPSALAAAEPVEQALSQVLQLIEHARLEEAQTVIDAALHQNPEDARVYNFAGVLSARQGRSKEAESQFRKAVSLAPRFTGAYLNLGRLLQENSAKDESAVDNALVVYETVLRYDPRNDEANFQAARLSLRKQAYKDVLERLDALPDAAQSRASVLSLRVASLAGLERGDEARDFATKLARVQDLSEADVLHVLPSLAAASQQTLAVASLEALKTRGGLSPGGLQALADLSRHTRDIPAARQTLERAFEQSPKRVDLLIELARLAYEERDFKGALGYLAHARDLDPENAFVHFFYGLASVELELPLEAKESLQRAVNLKPEQPYYNYAIGAVLLSDGDPSPAIDYIRKFRELRPDDPSGQFALGVAYYHTDRLEEAEQELLAAASRDRTGAGALYYLGRVALRKHGDEQAADYFRQATQAAPDYADAYADLGFALTRLKQFQQAEQALERALELEPNGYRPNLQLLFYYQRTRDSRAEQQRLKFDQIEEDRDERARLLLRRVEARPLE